MPKKCLKRLKIGFSNAKIGNKKTENGVKVLWNWPQKERREKVIFNTAYARKRFLANEEKNTFLFLFLLRSSTSKLKKMFLKIWY